MIKDRPWQIQGCSAMSGEGLQDGMKWIITTVRSPCRRRVMRLAWFELYASLPLF